MIYLCLAGESWEGASETFVTTNEKVAYEWCNKRLKGLGGCYPRDWVEIEVWKDETRVSIETYTDNDYERFEKKMKD